MSIVRPGNCCSALLLAWTLLAALPAPGADVALGKLVVSAGNFERLDSPIRFRCRRGDVLGNLAGRSDVHLALLEEGRQGPPIPVQWAPEPALPWENKADEGALVWILPGRTPKGARRTFRLVARPGAHPSGPFTVSDLDGRHLLVRQGGRPVLQYNYGVVPEKEGQTGSYDRAAYIHPVWTPGGKIITGDFSPEHIHQRGIYLAGRRVVFGEVETDFWGLGDSAGRVLPDGTPAVRHGPVFVEVLIQNRGVVGSQIRFREAASVRVWAHPAEQIWLFDVRFRQAPVDPDRPGAAPSESVTMVWPQVYYGGMAFRGASEWLGRESKDVVRALARGVEFSGYRWLPPGVPLDVLTSEAKDRFSGDRTPARWIDYTGPLSEEWGGVALFDHPSNTGYPNPLRIHPELPYFCYALAQNEPLVVRGDRPLDLVYRVLIHGGRPDAKRNEPFAVDFQRPPEVKWERPPSAERP